MHLPNRAAALDGSSSYDDHGIVEYEWSRDPKSPAAGVSVNMKNESLIFLLVVIVVNIYRLVLQLCREQVGTSAQAVKSL